MCELKYKLKHTDEYNYKLEGDSGSFRFSGWSWLSWMITIRDEGKCQWCGDKQNALEVHHIIPRDSGGSDHPFNLISLCHDCHAKTFGKHYENRIRFVKDGIPPGDPRFYENRAEVWKLWEKSLEEKNELKIKARAQEMDAHWESLGVSG